MTTAHLPTLTMVVVEERVDLLALLLSLARPSERRSTSSRGECV